jgi:modulator of FtsH protease HflK
MNEKLYDQLNLPPEVRKFLKNTRLIIFAILAIVLLFASVFQIGTEEVGVITRFGKYTRTVDPGLNMKIPFVESVIKVPVERQQKLEFGFRTTKPGVQSEFETNPQTADEALMLTGDLNLANVEWVVQYRINDAYKYLFKVRNLETTLREISEAAMRQIVGDRTVNEVLTVGRAEITQNVEDLIQSLCTEYSMGIKIEQIVLQDVNPPEPVKAAFNEVNQAQQEKQTLINQSKSEYSKIIPKASGEADETIQKAEGYAIERVNNAKGEAARFNALYLEYIKAPEITKRRIYLETMSTILPQIGHVIVTDQKGNSILPLLNMSLNDKIQKP